MDHFATLLGIVIASAALLRGAGRVALAVYELVQSTKANTAALSDLSSELIEYRTNTQNELTQLDHRVTHLEGVSAA